MTRTSTITASRPKPGADKAILGLLAVLILGALVYVMSQRQQALRSSPVGLDGLQVWLSSEGLSAQSFVGGWPLVPDDIGLMIVPLYDTDLASARAFPRTEAELIVQQDEYDLTVDPVRSKAGEVPTLLVLPKWRTGMRLTQIAHPVLRVEARRLEEILKGLLQTPDVQVSYSGEPFAAFSGASPVGPAQEAVIYGAQTFAAQNCTPVLGTAQAMILGTCPLSKGASESEVFVLSDPDLINNHGLALGDNAFLIRDFVARVAGDRQVIIDYSRDLWFSRDKERPKRARSWSDLLRFFSPPFTLIWVGFLIAAALTLWRAALRFGPLMPEPGTPGASKMMAIDARARLMRLSNRDGALVADYAKARLAATATALFGAAHARQFSTAEAFLAFTKRRHPRHAAALAEVLNIMRSLPDGAVSAQAMAAVATLDRILEQITHDT